MIHILYYDIREARPRVHLADYLEQQGLERIQFSVFIGHIEAHRWKAVWRHITRLHAEECEPTDKIFSHTIGREHFARMSILGPSPDIEGIMGDREFIYFGGQNP